MLRSMTARQFYEWQTFSEVEPFEQERLEKVITRINQTLMNVYRKKNAKALSLDDVTLFFGDNRKPLPPKAKWQDMYETAKLLVSENRRKMSGNPAPPQRLRGRKLPQGRQEKK